MPIIQFADGSTTTISLAEDRNLWLKSCEAGADWYTLPTGKCVRFTAMIKILDSGIDKFPDFLKDSWREKSSEEQSARRKMLMLEGIKRTNSDLRPKLCSGTMNNAKSAN